MCSWLPALHRFVSSPNLARWQLFNTKRAHCKNIHCHHPHPRHRHHPHDGQQRHPHHPHHPHPHYQNEQHCPHKLKSSSQWQLFPPKELDVKTLENAQQMNSWLAIVGKYEISAKYLETENTTQFHRDIFLEIKLSYYHHQQPPGNLD